MANAGLGGEVNDAVDVGVLGDEFGDGVAVGDVAVMEAEAGPVADSVEPGLLEADTIIVVEGIDADDGVAAPEQGIGDVIADEAGAAGDQDFHG
jgi:hypothetical protein